MVLGTPLITTRFVALAMLCAGCQAQELSVSDAAELNQHVLRLSANTEHCLLLVKNTSNESIVDLALRPPCYFARREDKKLQTHSYKDKGLSAVALVIGGPISEDQRKKWNLSNDMVCGDQKQAIFVSAAGLTASADILEGGISCKNKSIDEKDFYYFADQFKPQ